MHIALVIASLQPGGAERVLVGLGNAWVEKGHAVSLVTLSAPDAPCLYVLDPRIHLTPLNQLAADPAPFLVRLKGIFQRILSLRKALKAIKPDVVVSFVDVMNITTLLATWKLGIPVMVAERTHPAYYRLPSLYKALRRMVYPWANKVICQTASASSYFSWLPDPKKSIIPNGVQRARLFKEEKESSMPVQQLVSVGRLCPYKGFQDLIRAFSRLAPQNPQLKLVIYGEGSFRPALEKLIQKHRLEEQVFLPGVVEDIEAALYRADLFVFPSHYEGFPNALCEAMAVGLPVIASRCSGTVDIIREGVDGRLYPVGDVDQLAALLAELIQDPSQRVKLSQGALMISDRFNEKTILHLWDKILADVV